MILGFFSEADDCLLSADDGLFADDEGLATLPGLLRGVEMDVDFS